MLPETVIRLAEDFENIIAIKEAAGSMAQAMEIISKKPDNFMVISGDDKLALPVTLAGGSGVISVIGQAMPEEFSRIISLGLEDYSKEAYSLLYQLLPSIELIFEEGNPAGIKSMLEILGICSREVRLPLMNSSAELHQKIRNFVTNFKNKEYVI
jgi:4-hydroxy-tetrahydrodipicolinate synthase